MIASREPGIELVLLTEEQVQGRVRDLAAQISKDYAGRDVLLVGVLKGAFILMADLARHLTVPHEFDERLVNGLGGLADAVVDLRALECVQTFSSADWSRATVRVSFCENHWPGLSLTIARWPLRCGDHLHHFTGRNSSLPPSRCGRNLT
jgi:hypothetical protein